MSDVIKNKLNFYLAHTSCVNDLETNYNKDCLNENFYTYVYDLALINKTKTKD